VAASVVALVDRLRADQAQGRCVDTTLLALVQALADVTDDDREIVAVVIHLIRSGCVRLTGTFRNQRLDLA
jgi:hypothetical protein